MKLNESQLVLLIRAHQSKYNFCPTTAADSVAPNMNTLRNLGMLDSQFRITESGTMRVKKLLSEEV